MKIAIPLAEDKLCNHFGHCEQFALVTVDKEKKWLLSLQLLDPPPHEPGVLPRWLHEQGVNLIIAGGMGGRAQALFAEHDIAVVVGAPCKYPTELVEDYLHERLVGGQNICDH